MTCVYECQRGWMAVNDEYVSLQSSKLPPKMDPDEAARLRGLFRDSFYPCPSCRPEQYELWRGGHFAPDHTCEDCRIRKGKKRTPRAAA